MEYYTGRTFSAHCTAIRRLSLVQQRKLGNTDVAPPRTIRFKRDAHLPPLAWLCCIEDGNFDFTLGLGVEQNSARIVEGVWDGDFATSRIEDSDCVFGSGAAFEGRNVVFVPPKHGYEHLFVLQDRVRRRTLVSNSLCFTLAGGGSDAVTTFLALVPSGLIALDRLQTDGIDCYEPTVCENERYRLLRMTYYNFSADDKGAVRRYNAPPARPPANFADYRACLSRRVGEIFTNARSPARSSTFEPIASISPGYDSTACAVLAQEHGCAEALTLDVTVGGFNDSGAPLARALGLRLFTHRHVMGKTVRRLRVDFDGHLREAAIEFIATPGVGDDIAFLPFEPHLSCRLFITGGYGDSVWERTSTLSPGIPPRSVFSKSITEFRLRVGFAYLPLPFIAARFPQAIVGISQSDEMRPYSVAEKYDRPIPRRIAEEAGVPRDAFGARKNATAPLPLNHSALFADAIRQVVSRYCAPVSSRLVD